MILKISWSPSPALFLQAFPESSSETEQEGERRIVFSQVTRHTQFTVSSDSMSEISVNFGKLKSC